MILLNDFQAQWKDIGAEAVSAFNQVGSRGWYILGESVKKFEVQLAKYSSSNWAVGCGNGLDAIEIGLRLLDIQPGAKVLTTPLSAFATTLAIMRCNARPVFCDVDASGLLNLDLVQSILEQHPEIRYCVPVHLYGHALPLAQLRDLKNKFNLKIVEDCAQSIGAASGELPVASVGQTGALSFYPTKNLGCFGDGGALLLNEKSLNEKARALRDYGQSSKYIHSAFGLNSRLDEVHAEILAEVLLPRLNSHTDRRRRIAEQYRAQIRNPVLELPPIPPGSHSVWHLFPILVRGDRNAFQKSLTEHGVQSAVHYPKLIPDQEALKSYELYDCLTDFPLASDFARSEISIPIHPYLTDAEIDVVISACNAWRG